MENQRILADGHYMNNETWITKINNNDLIIGPSGAGKTRSYVKPNIMQCNESMIIADTKGNLYKETKHMLIEKGYKVILIDYKELGNSYGYNPFDFIRYNTETNTYSEQDIATMCKTLCPSINNKDPFWDSAARLYLSCLVSYIFEALPKSDHNFSSVLDLISIMDTDLFDALMEELGLETQDSFAIKQYNLFKKNYTAEKMHASILGILSERFNILNFSDFIRMYKNEKRIELQKIADKKTAVFLTISDTDRSMDRLIGLFYTQALQTLCNVADLSKGSKLKIPVRFMFDDFATNTVIENFDGIISVIRSRDIYVSIILQSVTQLDTIYGAEKACTIMNNCDNLLYLGGQDIKTSEMIAKKTNFPLSQILELPIDSAILLTRGSKSKQVKQYDIKNHENYHLLLEARGEDLEDLDNKDKFLYNYDPDNPYDTNSEIHEERKEDFQWSDEMDYYREDDFDEFGGFNDFSGFNDFDDFDNYDYNVDDYNEDEN